MAKPDYLKLLADAVDEKADFYALPGATPGREIMRLLASG
jgi:hypothetical protein